MISVVCNVDTRPGSNAEVSTIENQGKSTLSGVRSYDFLTAGVKNKLNFFSGHEIEVILFIDEHEPIPDDVWAEIRLVLRDVQHLVVCQPNERSSRRWNEALYARSLRLAKGDYIAHFDQDCAAFRDTNSDIILKYIGWLEHGYKFVCQPTTMAKEDHEMYWASTRFFICKRETLDFDAIEAAITNEHLRFAKYGHAPALEHVLGRMAGKDGVLYPPANWDDYMVFCWQTYHRGLLKKLNGMPFSEVRDYILSCGILGPNDVVASGVPT